MLLLFMQVSVPRLKPLVVRGPLVGLVLGQLDVEPQILSLSFLLSRIILLPRPKDSCSLHL